MKVPVRVIGRPYRGQAVGNVFNVSRGASRVLVATKRVELVDEPAPTEAAKTHKLASAVEKTVSQRAAVKKAAAKKAPANKVVAKKATTKTIRGTRNASMAGKTGTKAD